MSEKDKKNVAQEVRNILEREKIKTSLYPLLVASMLYGIQLSLFPQILETYSVYTMVSDFVPHWEIGAVFIILPFLMALAFQADRRRLLLFTSIMLLTVWSMFTVAFIFSPPPNTIWIFAALMTFLTFRLTRRV